MKFTYLFIATAMLGSLANGQTREKTFGDGQLPAFLADFDANGDGRIDEEERQAIVEARKAARENHRAEIDTDGNGEISQEEREAAREKIRSIIEAKRSDYFAEIAGEDGLLSLEEFSAIRQMAHVPDRVKAAIFARLDKDVSGSVSLEEFTARLRDHRTRPPEGPRPPDGGGSTTGTQG